MNNKHYHAKYAAFFLIICFNLVISGCNATFPVRDKEKEAADQSSEMPEVVIQLPEEEQPEEEKVSQLELLAQEQETYYAYSQLNENQKKIYLEIFTILNSMSKEIQISTIDTDEIDYIFKCVMQDHPELFFVEGYTLTKYTENNVIKKVTYSGTYTMSAEERSQRADLIEDYVIRCLAGAPVDGSEYEKVKYVYEYLVENTEYDLTAPDNQNISSTFINQRTVCQGYAKGTQYLLNRLGVFCTLINGRVKTGEPHVWNLVKVDGEYYHVDTTWGDASYNLEGMTDADKFDLSKLPEINYDYLCANDDVIKNTHVFDPVVPVPDAQSLDSYYYVKEGMYFTEFDEEKLKKIFQQAYDTQENAVSIKCSGNSVYQQMVRYFITDKKIFEYLNKDGGVSYMEEPEKNTLTFYI